MKRYLPWIIIVAIIIAVAMAVYVVPAGSVGVVHTLQRHQPGSRTWQLA